MTAPILDVLKRARARLAVPGQWTKGAAARDENGASVEVYADDAVCWCAIGAIYVEASAVATLPCGAIDCLRPSLPSGIDITVFNDAQETVEPVLALYDETIGRLEAGGAS